MRQVSSFLRLLSPQAFACQIDAMIVVDEAIQDGVGISQISDAVMSADTGSWLVMMVERRP